MPSANHRWRAGILGCGQISPYHHEAFKRLGIEPVALADRDPELLERRASQWEVPQAGLYNDFKDLLSDEALQLDLIACCLPPALHAEAAILAAERGIHVVVEKPMATSVIECQKMIEAHQRQGTKLMVTEMLRTIPRCRIAKQAIDQGLIGEPVLLDWVANVPPGWASRKPWARQKAEAGGGLYMDWGVHAVDLFRTVNGQIREVVARVDRAYHDLDVEDRGVAILIFENGVLGTMRVVPTQRPINEISIYGTEGMIRLDYTAREGSGVQDPVEIWSEGKRYSNLPGDPPLKSDVKEAQVEAYLALYTDFLGAIRENRSPDVSGEEGMADVAVIEAIYRSSDEGGEPVCPTSVS